MLFYRTFGNPENTLVVFLHGFLGSSLDFLPIIEECHEDFFCVAFDLPAHGKSPYLPGVLSSLKKAISSLQKPPTFVGYSMGGRIALHLEQILPTSKTIVLSSHFGLNTIHEKEEQILKEKAWQAKLKMTRSEDFLPLWYKQPIFSSLQKKQDLLKKHIKNRAYKNGEELALMMEEMSLGKQPFFNTPSPSTYFLCGEDDKKYRDLYSELPLSTYREIITGAGHAVLLENPKGCSRVIKEILLKKITVNT